MTGATVDPLVGKKLKPNFVILKQKIDVTKSHHKRVKAIIPNETITEEMIKSFELLKDNFKEIYNMQHQVKHKIEQMEGRQDFKHEEMRKSFIDEVSNIMTKITRK
jgi:phage shock protein A